MENYYCEDMFFSEKMLSARVNELAHHRYMEMKSIAPFVCMESLLENDEPHKNIPREIKGSLLELGDTLEGRDRYFWLQKEVLLPKEKTGCQLTGLFDFGKTGEGNVSGFEALLYLDRSPYQGIDTNHPDVIFDKYAGKNVQLSFLLWTGLEGNDPGVSLCHRIKSAHIGYLHTDTDTLYYLAKTIVETVALLPETSPEKHDLITVLEQSFCLLDWDPENLHKTVTDALLFLETELSRMEKHPLYTVHMIGHTHIDLAWLWRLKHTREKAMRSFSTVLRLMEEFDEYLFLQSQPQIYKFIQQDSPELYQQIIQRIREGRWEADGGMWVEADCNLSDGESLVRQFTHGISFLKQEFGVTPEFLWLPDVFGYSWALPQILNQCNIRTFMTTKISWNQYNPLPHDLFFWKGIDGSEILTYFITTPDEQRPMDAPFSTYNGTISPRSVLGNWGKFKDKNLSKEVALAYGYGDGGGGVNRDMLKTRRAMEQIPGLPHVPPSRGGDFFRHIHSSLEQAQKKGAYVHTWDGELYLEYHRGTYTSQAEIKKSNRYLEQLVTQAEWLASNAMIGQNIPYPQEDINKAWEIILLHQFHDIIPGSSIREVYDDTLKAYQEAQNILKHTMQKSVENLLEPQPDTHTIWHTGSYHYNNLIEIKENRDGIFKNHQGDILPAQKTGDTWILYTELPPFSMEEIQFFPGKPQPAHPSFSYDEEKLELDTPFYQVCWNQQGWIRYIFDKKVDRHVLASNECGNVFELYEDKPIQYDNWDIELYHLNKKTLLESASPPILIECGSERAILEVSYHSCHSTIRQNVIFYRRNRRIDFQTVVEWKENQKLLKVAFPLNIRATKASYDIQFGYVERPTHFNTSWDYARFEVVAHKWADISQPDYGVSLLNDCKYGYSAKDHVLRLTLLKSGIFPDPRADRGTHTFTYALYPHTGTVVHGGTMAQGHNLNIPVQVAQGYKPKDIRKLLRIKGKQVEVDAVKKAEKENCLVLRVHESEGAQGRFEVLSDFHIHKWAQCNLLEENISHTQTGLLVSEIHPFEIQTFKIWV